MKAIGYKTNELFNVEAGQVAEIVKEFFTNGESWYQLKDASGKLFESPSIFWDEAEVCYGVFLKGGSIGSNNTEPKQVFGTQDDAKECAKRRNKQLSSGEKSYYKMRYTVRKLS